MARGTAAFIEAHRAEPFLAYLSFYSVHAPLETTRALWQKYRDKAAALPAPEHRFVVDRTTPVRQVQDHPVYAGMVEAMDSAVGLVLGTLDRLGLADRTIVVFTADNGGVSAGDGKATSNLPLRGGKGRQWEGGIREPFYIKWPGVVPSGSATDTPATGADLFPTLLEAGRPAAAAPAARGRSQPGSGPERRQHPPRPLYWHYPHYGNQGGEPSSIIREGQWKLIHYYEDGRDELYNLQTDPGEQTDIAAQQPAPHAGTGRPSESLAPRGRRPVPDAKSQVRSGVGRQATGADPYAGHPGLGERGRPVPEPDFDPGNRWWGSQVAD